MNKSIDTMVNADGPICNPIEFLNSLNPSGLPAHELKLNVETPIVLRVSCLTVLIPMILVVSKYVPFAFNRLQFLVRNNYF